MQFGIHFGVLNGVVRYSVLGLFRHWQMSVQRFFFEGFYTQKVVFLLILHWKYLWQLIEMTLNLMDFQKEIDATAAGTRQSSVLIQ